MQKGRSIDERRIEFRNEKKGIDSHLEVLRPKWLVGEAMHGMYYTTVCDMWVKVINLGQGWPLGNGGAVW